MTPQHLDDAPRFLAEWYRPRLAEEPFGQAIGRIGLAARETSADGIELLQAIFLPDDEVTLCLFAAESPDLVARACRRADLPVDRITKAVEITPQRRPPAPET